MKKLLLYLVAFLSCIACSRQISPPKVSIPVEAIPTGPPAALLDSVNGLPTEAAKPEFKPASKTPLAGRILGLFSQKKTGEVVHTSSNALPKKLKNVTITINEVKGDQHNEHTEVAKKGQAATGEARLEAQTKTKGPAATGASTAKDLSNAGIASDITGDNNRPKLTNTAPPKLSGWDILIDNITGPTGQLIAVLFVAALVFVGVKFGLPKLLAKKVTLKNPLS